MPISNTLQEKGFKIHMAEFLLFFQGMFHVCKRYRCHLEMYAYFCPYQFEMISSIYVELKVVIMILCPNSCILYCLINKYEEN